MLFLRRFSCFDRSTFALYHYSVFNWADGQLNSFYPHITNIFAWAFVYPGPLKLKVSSKFAKNMFQNQLPNNKCQMLHLISLSSSYYLGIEGFFVLTMIKVGVLLVPLHFRSKKRQFSINIRLQRTGFKIQICFLLIMIQLSFGSGPQMIYNVWVSRP